MPDEGPQPAYVTDYRGRVYCVVCGAEERRLDPNKPWPKHCGRGMAKGCTHRKGAI